MSIEELILKIIEACNELSFQSVDYSRTSSLLSVLDKLVDCYQKKCLDLDAEKLDDVCSMIALKLDGVENDRSSAVLKEMYSFTVNLIQNNLGEMADEEKVLH